MHLEQEIAVDGAHESGGTHQALLIGGHPRPGKLGFGKIRISSLGLMIEQVGHCGCQSVFQDFSFTHAESFEILRGNVNPP